MSLLAISKKNNMSQRTALSLPAAEIPADQVHITEAAAARISELLLQESKPEGLLRVGVIGGGCSGFSYHFAIEPAAKPNDHIFQSLGAQICVDPKSLKLIGGSLLDWHDSMQRKGFSLKNPQAAKNCSCGESFSL